MNAVRCSLFALLLALPSLASAAAAREKKDVPAPEEVAKGKTPKQKLVPTAQEAAALLRAANTTEFLLADLERARAYFDRPDDQPLKPAERDEVLRLWASLLDYEVALDGIKDRFRDSWHGTKDKNGELRAWLVGFSAYVGQLRASMAIVALTTGKPAYEKLLNEPQPEFGVGGGHLDRLKKHALSPRTAIILRAAWEYGHAQLEGWKDAGLMDDGPFLDLTRYARAAWETTDKLYWKKGVPLATRASLGMLRDDTFKAIFPAQAGIAGWLGDTRVRREGKNLITEKQLDTLVEKMQPGDILVERRNWYLSNVGLPGFWPHAELYVGTPELLKATLDADPEVKKVWPEGFSAYLAKTFPEKFKEFTAPAKDGKPVRIIEAISEGVSFSSMDEAALADYLGVMRPRLTSVEKARAIARAFAHQGKPYDFDFDFLTDSVLVCSELVYKSFQAGKDEGRSLAIPLVKVAGRTTLPANELVRKFAEELGTPKQQLDFVAFLDGHEAEQKAVFASAEEFRDSYKRVKWDIAQK